MSPVPIPIGPIATGGGRIGMWLWEARQSQAETTKVVRHALRMSICRFDPYAPGVDELATRIETRMWELARPSTRGLSGVARVGARLRRMRPFGRRFKRRGAAIDFPDWRQELENWVSAAVDDSDYAAALEAIGCRNQPEDGASLAERFPAMFDLELASERRLNAFRLDLQRRLRHVDEVEANAAERRWGESSSWLGGAVGAASVGVGLTVAELGHWSDPLFLTIAGATSLTALLVALAQARRVVRLTDAQRTVRMAVRMWVASYLGLLTGTTRDRDPLVMLQEVIERESAARYGLACPGEAGQKLSLLQVHGGTAGSAKLDALRDTLGAGVIPEAERVGEGHVLAVLRHVAATLDESEREPQRAEEMLPVLLRLLAALALAPPGADAARRTRNGGAVERGA